MLDSYLRELSHGERQILSHGAHVPILLQVIFNAIEDKVQATSELDADDDSFKNDYKALQMELGLLRDLHSFILQEMPQPQE